MFHNNNQAIIKKTAKKSLAANKGRNAFIMFAVFLTTFMLGTIISLSVSYMETQKAHKNRLMGTTAHVNLTNVTDDQIEKIKNLDYVSICSYSIKAGSVKDEGYLNGNSVILEYCESVEWEHFRRPIISNIVGNYPLKIDEIMLPVWILDNMGITEPVLCMEIPLVYQIDTKQPQSQTFKLCGYFTSYALFRPGSTDLDIYIESMSKNINGDISLINRIPDYANFYDFDDYQAFTPEFIEQLNSLPGLVGMKMRYVQLIKKDSGFLDMQGNIYYTLEFISVSEEGDIAEFDNDLNQFVGEPVIYEIDLYIDSAKQTQALSLIKEWTNKQQYIQWRSGIETRVETENMITTLMIMGSSISIILWLIGMINFINVITTSILSRRHELALLEIIGQSPKQSKKMLTSEGIIYAVITLLLVGIFGGSLTYGLYSLLASQYDYVVFNFPYIPILVMVCIVFAICLSIPRLTYKLVTKMTLVDRLREVE